MDRVHLFDVGESQYGDAAMVCFGERSVLIDGAHPGRQNGDDVHPSIPDQVAAATGRQDGVVDLLVISHAHRDHIGCLPYLIKHDLLHPTYALVPDRLLAWGQGPAGGPIDAGLDPRVLQVLAGMREEPPSRRTTVAELEEFLTDARTQDETYSEMLDQLEARGTHIVRFGREPVDDLEAEFSDIGLRVLGPSQAQVLITAEFMARQREHDAAALAAVAAQDSATSAVDLFRRAMFADDTDALDATHRAGHLVNLQSIVTVFDHDDHRVLFAGDMQLEDPGEGDPKLLDAIQALREGIADAGPYDFAKVSHHGSPNAIGLKVLADLGSTPLLGICAGEHSEKHPERSVLELLAARGLEWGRTDRNGAVTVEFTDQGAALHVTRGQPSDPTPNSEDVMPSLGQPTQPGESQGRLPPVARRVDEHVEVTVRVPLGTEATVHIEATGSRGDVAGSGSLDMADPMRIGGGRPLPSLLWLTHPRALAENIGQAESVALLAGLRSAGQPLLLDMPPPTSDPTPALRQVRDALASAPATEGVVILGGYDVVPGTRLDTLTPELRESVGDAGDPDKWVVWSDDAYGDVDGDTFPELPVSRIPDFKMASVIRGAVEAAPPGAGERRSGIRNRERPFAQPIFDRIDGTLDMLRSAPDQAPPPGITGVEGRNVYLMLHGSWADGTRFWGEGETGSIEALTSKHVRSVEPDVAFAGCCWGALITEVPAAHARPGQPLVSKPADGSIAAAFLMAGARAFIGCTGAHYSPTQAPYGYFGGPLHEEFWTRIASGAAPAQALFDAKSAYAAGIPHSRPHAREIAVELKIFRQFTCLGLGW